MSKLLSQCKFDLLEELVAKEVKYTFSFPLKINVFYSCNRMIYSTPSLFMLENSMCAIIPFEYFGSYKNID